MLVFIHENFKLDLTYLKVTFLEENQMFKDDFSLEISFPFEIPLDTEFTRKSGFSGHYNAHQEKASFDGKLDRDGVIDSAVLKIQEVKGRIASAVINSGLQAFPGFDKKLSDLPLEFKNVEDILEEAELVIGKAYPETNFNFRMVHTDKYDPTDEDWNGFEKIINNYKSGAFIENTIQEDSNIDLIKNIMQPFPYLMHVVQVAIQSSGYTLQGDILNDMDLRDALIFRDGNYYTRLSEDAIQIRYKNREWDSFLYSFNGYNHYSFFKQITIEKKGDYVLSGEVLSVVYRDTSNGLRSNLVLSIAKISGGVSSNLFLYQHNGIPGIPANYLQRMKTQSFEQLISFEEGDVLEILKIEPQRDSVPSETPDFPEAISLQLTPVRFRNPDGTPILSVLNLNEINLGRCVPDMTVRDLFTAIKNFKNYNFLVEGSVVSMNKNQNALKRQAAIDLVDFEIVEPIRSFHDDREFELAFSDGNSEKYKYDSMLVKAGSTIINDYITRDSTSEIKINLLPLPVVARKGVTTALSFEDDNSKLRLLFSKPMPEGGLPVAYLNENVLIPKLYENDYSDWLRYRINSIGWNWDFLIPVEKLRAIKIQSLFFAYKNYHLFSEIEKERLNLSWWRVTAKSESLL